MGAPRRVTSPRGQGPGLRPGAAGRGAAGRTKLRGPRPAEQAGDRGPDAPYLRTRGPSGPGCPRFMATEKGTRRASSVPSASVGICHLEPVSPLSAQPRPPAPASPPHLAGAGGGGRAGASPPPPPPPPWPRPGPCAGGSAGPGRLRRRGRGPGGSARAGAGAGCGGQGPGRSSAPHGCEAGAPAKVAREEQGEGAGAGRRGRARAGRRASASERAGKSPRESARNRAPMARMRGGEGRAEGRSRASAGAERGPRGAERPCEPGPARARCAGPQPPTGAPRRRRPQLCVCVLGSARVECARAGRAGERDPLRRRRSRGRGKCLGPGACGLRARRHARGMNGGSGRVVLSGGCPGSSLNAWGKAASG